MRRECGSYTTGITICFVIVKTLYNQRRLDIITQAYFAIGRIEFSRYMAAKVTSIPVYGPNSTLLRYDSLYLSSFFM